MSCAGVVPLLALLGLVLGFASATPGAAQTYYEDVRPVLIENCAGCHTADGIAWSMDDADRTFERAPRIARAIDLRRMPPFLAEPGHQDYVGDLSLDDETVAMVRAWAAAGYPEGEPRPDPEPGSMAHAGHGAGFAGDLTLQVQPAGVAYLPNQEETDDYRCFLVDWTPEAERYITGFRAAPGNTNVAHHVVVYAVQPEMWERYRELDDVEEGPGYTCFGGALPDRLFSREARAEYETRYPDGLREMSRANSWLAHWAPGMDGHVFPAGTGIRMAPGSGLVVQMHYYSSSALGEADQGSRMDFITAASVDRPAMHLPQTKNEWLGSERNGSMVIPAGEVATYEYRDDLDDLVRFIGYTTGVAEERIQGIEIHSANLHMHAFGHSGEVMLTHADGRAETLLRIPRWDLGWQRDFTFAQPKVLGRDMLEGASLAVRCTFENDTDGPVYGGYGSYDEMCFNFSYIAVQEGEPVPTEGEGSRD